MQRLSYPLMLLFLFLAFSFHASAEEIKIGVSLGLTGKYGEIADMQLKGFILWQEEVNKKGGLLGRKVRLIVHDDKSDPELARSIYEALIKKDNVDLLFAPYSSEITEAIAPVVERYGYPILVSGASSDKLWQQGYRYLFGVYSPASTYASGFLKLLVLNGLKTIGVIYAYDVFSVEVARGAKTLSERLKLDLLLFETFKKDREIPEEIVKRLKELRPDALIVCGHLKESVDILKLLKKVRWYPRAYFASVGPNLDKFYEIAGRDGEGVFSSSQWEPENGLKGSLDFYKSFIRRFNKKPSYHAATAYSAGKLLEEALMRVGSLDREKIREVLSLMDTLTIIGRYKVNRSGMQINHINLTIQWQNKRREIIWPEEMATRKPIFRR